MSSHWAAKIVILRIFSRQTIVSDDRVRLRPEKRFQTCFNMLTWRCKTGSRIGLKLSIRRWNRARSRANRIQIEPSLSHSMMCIVGLVTNRTFSRPSRREVGWEMITQRIVFTLYYPIEYSGSQKSWPILPCISYGSMGHDFCGQLYISKSDNES